MSITVNVFPPKMYFHITEIKLQMSSGERIDKNGAVLFVEKKNPKLYKIRKINKLILAENKL